MQPRIGKLLLVTAALVGLTATAARAQDYRNDAAWYGGAVVFGDLNSGAGGGSSISPDAGWIVGLEGTHWWGSGRVGGRINGAFTKRPISLPDRTRSIGITMADADLLLRFLPANTGNRVSPYIGVGAGVVYYGLGPGERLVFPEAGAVYEGDDHLQFAPVGTFGIDVLTNLHWDDNPIGVRIELTDHMALKSPFKPINGGDFDPIHNFRLSLGLFSGFGILR